MHMAITLELLEMCYIDFWRFQSLLPIPYMNALNNGSTPWVNWIKVINICLLVCCITNARLLCVWRKWEILHGLQIVHGEQNLWILTIWTPMDWMLSMEQFQKFFLGATMIPQRCWNSHWRQRPSLPMWCTILITSTCLFVILLLSCKC